MAEARLYDPRWWALTVDRGIPLSFTYTEIPVEELMACDEMSRTYPGLRFNLRKQRGRRYLLTILPSRHMMEDENEVKGEA